MARQAHHAVLVLVALTCAAGAAAQGGANFTGSLGDVSCLAATENRNAGLPIAQSCGNLASSVTSSGANVNIDCPANCGAAFNKLTVACRNDLTGSAALGSTYRLIFNACDVSFSGSNSSNGSSTPTAAATNATANGTAFACLADSANIDAGTRFARFCSGGALQPRPDSSTNLGFTVTCPANCAAALNNVTKGCISDIANSNNFGGIYQEIFRACNVSGGSNSTTPTRTPPAAGAATVAPTAAPSAAATDAPAAVPTSGGAASTPTDSSTTAPTAAPTAAPAPQSAPRTAGSLAAFATAGAAAASLLALLA